jgi:hypothetical protein
MRKGNEGKSIDAKVKKQSGQLYIQVLISKRTGICYEYEYGKESCWLNGVSTVSPGKSVSR